MNMININSSAINAIGYDENSNHLRIEFSHGNTYDYYNVPKEIFEGLLNASSAGSYYNQYIKDKF
jgi:KTSC domain-containing protein